MTMDIECCLIRHQEKIVQEWARCLYEETSAIYQSRPWKELVHHSLQATDAYFHALVHNDFSRIEAFIKKISKIRVIGFNISDVQGAFEFYRSIVVPIFIEELDRPFLLDAFQRLNNCFAFTIQRFSEYFKILYEKYLLDYAVNLEKSIEERTQALAESEKKYRILVEEINDGFFVIKKKRIVFANKTYCEMHGYPYEQVIGRYYLDFVDQKSLEEVTQIHEVKILEGGDVDRYIYYRLHKDGSCFATENKVTRMMYGGTLMTIGICRDITERMEMEQKVRDSEHLAYVGQLTASLGHEIRNPLSSIKVNIDALLRWLKLEGHNKRRMEIISHEILRLERILGEMLDFSRPVRPIFESVSIEALIQSCLEVLEDKFKDKGVVIKMTPCSDLPNIIVDSGKMEQVFINIFLNAVEMLPQFGWIEIKTSWDSTVEDNVRIRISDNGKGVEPEEIPLLFDPFHSGRRKGIGLGLFNVKKIVEAHGGTVNVSSERSSGFCLEIALPGRQSY